MPETREFVPAGCFRWKCETPVAWVVYELDSPEESAEWILTCDQHKMEAFS